MRYALLVLACVAVMAGLRFSTVAHAQGQPAAQHERWEYATYSYSSIGGKPFYTLVTSKERVSEGDFDALFKKLGGKTPPGQMAINVMLFDLLGESGWEIFAIESSDPAAMAKTTMYYMKRRKA